VRDVPSRGTSFKIAGIKIKRVFQLSSEQEATYFFLSERNPNIDWTIEACGRLGVRHPHRDGYPPPFTLDFLITESLDGELHERAPSIKTPEDAANPRYSSD
jgi:hypothetical protein